MFMMKLLEGNEEKAQINYSKITGELSKANQILAEEAAHEELLIEMIDEKPDNTNKRLTIIAAFIYIFLFLFIIKNLR